MKDKLEKLSSIAFEIEKILADNRHPQNSVETLEAYKKMKEMYFWVHQALIIRPPVKFDPNAKKPKVAKE
jgi:hypothetical protein